MLDHDADSVNNKIIEGGEAKDGKKCSDQKNDRKRKKSESLEKEKTGIEVKADSKKIKIAEKLDENIDDSKPETDTKADAEITGM